jgi:hypothetical protein
MTSAKSPKTDPLPSVRCVWRIPTRAVFRKKHPSGDPTWDQVYGKSRCSKCHQLMKEGDVYERDPEFISGKVHKYQHVECPEKVKKV